MLAAPPRERSDAPEPRTETGTFRSGILGRVLDGLSWRLRSERAAGAPSTDDFYVLKVVRVADSAPEAMELTNDVALTPEPVATPARMDGTGESGFVVAFLTSDMDVDHFSFDVGAMRTITIACGSATSGSGVRGLSVQLIGPSDTVIAMETEAPPDGVLIQDAMPVGTGTHVIRLSKTGQDAEVTGNWVRCGIHLNDSAP